MKLSRRDFLQISVLSAGSLGMSGRGLSASATGAVAIIADPEDPLLSAPPVRWAMQDLATALRQTGVTVQQLSSLAQAPPLGMNVVAGGAERPFSLGVLGKAGLAVPNGAESLALVPFSDGGRSCLLACGRDARGLMYALLELADRVRHGNQPIQALSQESASVEQPFNALRSVGRLFSSDVEDNPWFNDREMWPAYFAMLAAQRFNRFSLNLGIGYDSLDSVRDAYFLFAYPFLLAVPGFKVRAISLPDAERDRNLETLRYISQQAVAHGLDFQLGIWTHGYTWRDSTHANYVIEGLKPETHATYSRAALAELLRACPDISGVTIRTHGESGVREKSYSFWETVFAGAVDCGRKVNLDLHTKGLDQRLIDVAVKTGLPLTLSPKYWAEHMGLPYHQAAIRESELPREDVNPDAFDTLSTGSRVFTRYGYADFLREDRSYQIMYRIWPGTHRFLLWGDPASAAAHAKAFRFCGSNGVELYEPLSFKGRRGSGLVGNRCGYADASLAPHWDWEKYLYTYRTWGRLTYNPETQPDVWQRYLRQRFQAAAPGIEESLANATRILPLVTTAHLPSAANDAFGPELYANQSMLHPADPPYWDTPVPKIFDYVSPLDPQMFSSIHDFADGLLKSERTGKYSPVEAAQWLEDMADRAEGSLQQAEARFTGARSPEFRRTAADIRIQIGLGRFFAAKLRAGVLHAIHQQCGSRAALQEAVNSYRRARGSWSQIADDAKNVYVPDITFGPLFQQRGHWSDRLPAIDADIAELATQLEHLSAAEPEPIAAGAAIREALGRPRREIASAQHSVPANFRAGEACLLSISVPASVEPISVRLYYRHVNQAERYQLLDMEKSGHEFAGAIPAGYTSSKFPLQYYFEFRQSPQKAWLYPGFEPGLHNQPYYVVRHA